MTELHCDIMKDQAITHVMKHRDIFAEFNQFNPIILSVQWAEQRSGHILYLSKSTDTCVKKYIDLIELLSSSVTKKVQLLKHTCH